MLIRPDIRALSELFSAPFSPYLEHERVDVIDDVTDHVTRGGRRLLHQVQQVVACRGRTQAETGGVNTEKNSGTDHFQLNIGIENK